MELIDIYDVDGAPTGKKVPIDTSKETLELGEYIGVSQVFIQNKRGEFLIERSAKKTGYQYLPVGGHIMASEDPIKAVIRETREEIGLDLDESELYSLKNFTNDSIIRFVYYMRKNLDLSELQLQQREVSSVYYMSVDHIMYMSANGLMDPAYMNIMPEMLRRIEQVNKKYK